MTFDSEPLEEMLQFIRMQHMHHDPDHRVNLGVLPFTQSSYTAQETQRLVKDGLSTPENMALQAIAPQKKDWEVTHRRRYPYSIEATHISHNHLATSDGVWYGQDCFYVVRRRLHPFVIGRPHSYLHEQHTLDNKTLINEIKERAEDESDSTVIEVRYRGLEGEVQKRLRKRRGVLDNHPTRFAVEKGALEIYASEQERLVEIDARKLGLRLTKKGILSKIVADYSIEAMYLLEAILEDAVTSQLFAARYISAQRGTVPFRILDQNYLRKAAKKDQLFGRGIIVKAMQYGGEVNMNWDGSESEMPLHYLARNETEKSR